MHELSVTEALLALAVQHGRAAHAKQVTGVHVAIGQLSSIMDESVQFYWDLISAGTLASGARLHFRRVPALFRCLDCGRDYALEAGALACPACGSVRVSLVAGDDLCLEALDIEPEAAQVMEAVR